MTENQHLRFEPQQPAPHRLAAAMAAQTVLLITPGIIFTPLVAARAAGIEGGSAAWLVFAALIAAGFSTMLQVVRLGIFGSGYVMFVGSNVAFITVAATAMEGGGLALLASLSATSALATLAFTRWMPALRRVLTPAVGGVVLMLMAMNVAPIVWGMLRRVPEAFEDSPGVPLAVAVTIAVILPVAMLARGMLRLWAALIGVVAGTCVAAGYGFFDPSAIASAAWIGLPDAGWPGLDLTFPPLFWALLPAFMLFSLVGCIETYADSVAVQRWAHHTKRPIDFKVVQGAINADGAGSFVAGMLGTLPNTVYSMSLAITEITGVASRRVGWWGGGLLVLLAFSPKVAALFGAIPSPVAGAYILVMIVLLFGHGLRLVTEDGLGFEAGLAACMGFFVGIGFQEGALFNELLPVWSLPFLANGTTSGGLTAIALMGLLSLRSRSRDAVTVDLAPESFSRIRDLVLQFGRRLQWDRPSQDRLVLAAEEAMLFLVENAAAEPAREQRRQLTLRLRRKEEDAELEFIVAPVGTNAESAIAALAAVDEATIGDQVSLRLLRGLTRDVRHLQFHRNDYLLVSVDRR